MQHAFFADIAYRPGEAPAQSATDDLRSDSVLARATFAVALALVQHRLAYPHEVWRHLKAFVVDDELQGLLKRHLSVRIKVLGEYFVAFRDTAGRLGLLDARCPHRGADLSFGFNEEGGIRCAQCFWKFDVDGNILDLPMEPEDSPLWKEVKAPAFKISEYGGLIWAYFGPQDDLPDLPEFEWTRVGYYSDLQVTRQSIPTAGIKLRLPFPARDVDLALSFYNAQRWG